MWSYALTRVVGSIGMILLLGALPLLGACTTEVAREVVREVPVEKEVVREVVKEVPVEKVVTREVPKEVVVEKEVIKEVPVEKLVERVVEKEVIKEVPAQKPEYGGILRYWVRTDPPTLDPHWTRNSIYFGPGAMIFSGLARFDHYDESMIVPDLAERWDVGVDGTTYTFHLRRGVKWHDGRPFTAADVKFSLEKMADPKRSPEIAGTFNLISGVDVPDDYTVVVHLASPMGYFISALALPIAVIEPKHVADVGIEANDTRFLVGTGPFKIKEYVRGVSIEVERNPDYYVEGLPYLDGVKIYIIKDREAQKGAFVAHRVDMTHPMAGIASYDELQDLKSLALDANFKILRARGSLAVFTGQLKPGTPWNDPKVRQAVNLLVDREEVILGSMGHREFGSPGGFMPPGTPYAMSKQEVADFLGTSRPYEERVAEAKRLMSESAYPNGFKGKLLVRANQPNYERPAVIIADVLRQHLNIELTLEVRELSAYLDALLKRDFDFTVQGRTGRVIGPAEVLGNFYITDAVSNESGYSNPELDKLYQRILTTPDLEERYRLGREADSMLANDIPELPIQWFVMAIAWWPEVKNWVPHDRIYSSHLVFDQVWLSQ